jgi:hypothetical protein
MRCPGYLTSEDLTVENVTIDVYMSPQELSETSSEISKHTALLVQSFGENIVLPHLRRFAERCRVEKVVPPQNPCKSIIIIPCSLNIYNWPSIRCSIEKRRTQYSTAA